MMYLRSHRTIQLLALSVLVALTALLAMGQAGAQTTNVGDALDEPTFQVDVATPTNADWWIVYANETGAINFTTSSNGGGSWSTPQTITGGEEMPTGSPGLLYENTKLAIAAKNADEALVAWVVDESGANWIRTHTTDRGSTWSKDTNVTGVNFNNAFVEVAISDDGSTYNYLEIQESEAEFFTSTDGTTMTWQSKHSFTGTGRYKTDSAGGSDWVGVGSLTFGNSGWRTFDTGDDWNTNNCCNTIETDVGPHYPDVAAETRSKYLSSSVIDDELTERLEIETTTDGGSSFTQVETFSTDCTSSLFDQEPLSGTRAEFVGSNTYFVATKTCFDAHIFKTTDFGNTWTNSTSINATDEAANPDVGVSDIVPGMASTPSGQYVATYPGGKIVTSASLGDPAATPQDPDLSLDGFTNLIELGTNHQRGVDSKVYVKDRIIAEDDSEVSKLSRDLVIDTTQKPCEDQSGLDSDTESPLFVERSVSQNILSTAKVSTPQGLCGMTSELAFQRFWNAGDRLDTPVKITGQTLNNIHVLEVSGTDDKIFAMDFLNAEVMWGKTATDFRDVATDRTNGRVAATGDAGTFVWTSTGTRIDKDETETGRGVAIHDTHLWTCDGSGTTVYNLTVGSFTANGTNSELTCQGLGLQITSDGSTIATMDTTGTMRLANATSLTLLAATESINDPQDHVFSFDNDLLYAINKTTIFRFDVSDVTNTTTQAEPGEEGEQEDTFELEEEEGFGSLSESNTAGAFGISEESAGWFLGAFLVLGIGGGLILWSGNPSAGFVGAVAGLTLATPFGWIPLWFTLTIGVVAAAILVFLR